MFVIYRYVRYAKQNAIIKIGLSINVISVRWNVSVADGIDIRKHYISWYWMNVIICCLWWKFNSFNHILLFSSFSYSLHIWDVDSLFSSISTFLCFSDNNVECNRSTDAWRHSSTNDAKETESIGAKWLYSLNLNDRNECLHIPLLDLRSQREMHRDRSNFISKLIDAEHYYLTISPMCIDGVFYLIDRINANDSNLHCPNGHYEYTNMRVDVSVSYTQMFASNSFVYRKRTIDEQSYRLFVSSIFYTNSSLHQSTSSNLKSAEIRLELSLSNR